MRYTMVSSRHRLGILGIASAMLGLAGCGVQLDNKVSAPTPVTVAAGFTGSVYGGQQPIYMGSVQLYAASSTLGYGAASAALLATPAITDINGKWTAGSFTCPYASSETYVVATGGISTTGGSNNPSIALMTALGPCGSLGSYAHVAINELTTIAAAYSLSGFMTTAVNVGSTPTNSTGLADAFASASQITNPNNGFIPGILPTGAQSNVTELDTLGDILAYCVNSGSPFSACTTLFNDATPSGGTAPTDTIQAALDIARNPSHNVSILLPLANSSAPFQPTLTSATDFTISIKYTSVGLSGPRASAVDPSGNLWVTNSGNNTVSVLSTLGVPASFSPLMSGGLSGPSGVAIDSSGNAWVTNKTATVLSTFTPAGVATQSTISALNAASAVAIDGVGSLWITNSGNSSLTKVVPSGTAVSSTTTFSPTGLSSPVAVAINPH